MIGFTSALVTGATGFIGSALVRRLADEGIKVYCIVRPHSANLSRLTSISGIELVEVQSFHVSELQRALAGISADVVFNLASYGVDQKDRDPEAMLEGNANLVARLLLATADWPLKWFIHTGSCFEYGLTSISEPISEDMQVQPASLYGSAKAASVIYGNALAAQLGIPFVTLRLFGVFGTGEAPHRLIPYMIEHLTHDEIVDLTPGGQVRDLIYVDDAAEAFLMAGQCNQLAPYTVYNICSGQPISIQDVAEVVADVMDKPRSLLHFGKRSYRPDEAMWIVGDNHRFKAATNWQPKVSIREGIQRMVAVS
ncbi:MAG: NAD(P)-dependent oxidoreductase [Actinobacteria bacterium]|nr:NAD(P)-dependent oxidoreductase [Actinomycetota bacterium]